LDENARFRGFSAGMKNAGFSGPALANIPDLLLLDEPNQHLDRQHHPLAGGFLLKFEKTLNVRDP